MVWTTYTTAQMDTISRLLFMPLMLLVNYTLLLFLLMFYWARRSEWRVRLLFAVASLGVACLVPFANPDDHTFSHLNDVSEACCGLTFLLQITIIGYDLNRKIKFRTVMILTYVAEALILVDCTLVVLSMIDVIVGDVLPEEFERTMPTVCDNLTLVFIFVFRYYYIIASRGWRDVWENRKLEVCLYVLYTTHQVPFAVLEEVSGLSWESPLALWSRVTLAGCLWVTARTKIQRVSVDSAASVAHMTPSAQPRCNACSSRSHAGTVYVVADKESEQQTERQLVGADRPQSAAGIE